MYSKEHINYLKKIKKNKCIIRLFQILIIVIFIFAWQILADKQIINTFIFSSPKKVIACIINLHQKKNLYNNILITIFETFFSFLTGALIGLLIATIMWWNKFIAKVIEPYLTVINSLPKVALGPIIIIWAGAGMKSIILMALLISVIVSTISIYQGFIETDPLKIKLMKTLGANKFQTYSKLILPASVSNIVSVLKINVSMSLIGM